MTPRLRTLLVGDDARSWADAGFTVDGDEVWIGDVRILLTGADGVRGVQRWGLTDVEAGLLDGLDTARDDGAGGGAPTPSPVHPNRAERIDHVVVRTPDLERTVAALEAAGFEARRRRDIPGARPPTVQVFFWAHPAIVELVGPVEPTGDGPAEFSGLALTCDDLDTAASNLGDRLTPPKTAVQAGRRIATVHTDRIGVSVPLALMSPHVP